MTVEELMSKYAGAYDSDFDMPEQSSEEEGTDNETSGNSSAISKNVQNTYFLFTLAFEIL